jgi:hypothetical protein
MTRLLAAFFVLRADIIIAQWLKCRFRAGLREAADEQY